MFLSVNLSSEQYRYCFLEPIKVASYDSNGHLFSPDADAGFGDDVFKLQRLKTESVTILLLQINVQMPHD